MRNPFGHASVACCGAPADAPPSVESAGELASCCPSAGRATNRHDARRTSDRNRIIRTGRDGVAPGQSILIEPLLDLAGIVRLEQCQAQEHPCLLGVEPEGGDEAEAVVLDLDIAADLSRR